jgi:hypothetical protein
MGKQTNRPEYSSSSLSHLGGEKSHRFNFIDDEILDDAKAEI